MDRAAFAAFLDAHPEYGDTARSTRCARPSTGGSTREWARLSRLHRRRACTPIRRSAQHAELLDAARLRQPALGQPQLDRDDGRSSSERGGRCSTWFNAPAGDYTAVFTPNATGGAEARRRVVSVRAGGRLLLTADNHNSVNGIREFARARGAAVDYAPLTMPELRIDRDRLHGARSARDPAAARTCSRSRRSRISRA